jgi:histone H3/H4
MNPKEEEELCSALQKAIVPIVLAEDRRGKTKQRTASGTMCVLTELVFQYVTKSLSNDLVAFSNHANRKSTIAPEDVALILRKLPIQQADSTVSAEAAEHNTNLLRVTYYDIARLLETQLGTTAGFRSEFRPISQIKPLLQHHPGYNELGKVILHGMDYRFKDELTEDERSNKIAANLQRGDHKLAEENSPQVAKLLKKDVTHGFT